MSQFPNNLQNTAEKLIDLAQQAGAIHADGMAVADTGESISIRHGKVESIEREDAQGIGLRAFVETNKGLAFASASTSDVSDQGLAALAKQVIEMARISEADPDAIAPTGADHPSNAELKIWQEQHAVQGQAWTTEDARDAALQCEDTALSYSDKISNSEGASAGFGNSSVVYAASDGFTAGYDKSSASLSVSVIAGKDESMQRDYAWHRAAHAQDLKSPQELGQEAATRAAQRLGAKAISSRQCPIIFEPRIATSIVGHLISAINGRAVLQQRSFLADSKGEMIFPEFITLSDNPDHAQGLGNRLFDGEGTRCKQHTIIDSGRLTGFLTDRYAAKRLNVTPTGHARRGLTGDTGIGTSNLIMQAGELSFEQLLQEIGDGFLVTEMMGFGINGVTGDYSRGAGGLLIENGKITHPVQEITIAGNLKEMFANISHLGNDLTWFGSSAVPSIVIDGMTIAGQGQ